MNKAILLLAIFAFCLTPNVLSSDLKENENRELVDINLGDILKLLNGTVTYPKINTTTPTTPITNTTAPTTPTTPVTNTTTPTTPSTPVTNTTTPTTPVTNTTAPTTPTTPVTNSTTPTTPVTNTTNSTNTTTAAPIKYYKNDVNMTSFPDDCLRVHNQERMAVGLANVTWSESLAASAQTWAENMAVNGFRHSGKTGENIASSSYTTLVLSRLLGLWVKEKYHFIVGCKYPSCSNTTAEVGHYTQMVWHSTTQVGCGFAPGANRGYNYLCCQYYKAGNVIGQYVY